MNKNYTILIMESACWYKYDVRRYEVRSHVSLIDPNFWSIYQKQGFYFKIALNMKYFVLCNALTGKYLNNDLKTQ